MKRITVVLALVSIAAVFPAAAAFAEDATAEDFLNYFKPLAGQWKVKYIVGDNTVRESIWSCTLSPTKRCFVTTHALPNEPPFLHTLEGYDPGSRSWKIVCFFSNGDHAVVRIRIDAGSLKGNPKHVNAEQTRRMTTADGKVVSETRTSVYTDLGRDKWECLLTGQTAQDGKKAPDIRVVYERLRQ